MRTFMLPPLSLRFPIAILTAAAILSATGLASEPADPGEGPQLRWAVTIRGGENFRVTADCDLYCDRNGSLYLLSPEEHRLVKLGPDGQVIGETGSLGLGKGRFNRPIAICSPDGGLNLFVLDSKNRRVVRLNSALKWIDEIEVPPGTSRPVTGDLVGLAVDAFGNLYISDPENRRVLKLDREGLLSAEITAGAALFSPRELTVDDRNYMYVRDAATNSILEFDDFGNRVGRLDFDSARLSGSLWVRRGYGYICDSATGFIRMFDLRRSAPVGRVSTSTDSAACACSLIAGGPGQRIWVGDAGHNRICGYDPAGK